MASEPRSHEKCLLSTGDGLSVIYNRILRISVIHSKIELAPLRKALFDYEDEALAL
jgi:hypothetical protein